MNGNERNREDDFLLQEHREIWEFVRKITDLEHGWLKFYWTIVAASFAALGVLYHYAPSMWEERYKLWLVASAILFGLIVVSAIVLRNFFVLRKRSVEYRNNLNIIRAWFLSRHAPKFDTFLEEKKQKEKQNKKETKFRWKYLPREPDQKFLTPGAEIRGVQLFIGIPSLIAGGFLFAITRFIIHSWDLRFGSEYAANYRLCFIVMLISIVATATTWYFIIALFKRYGKKDDDKNLLRDGQD